jgi:chromosome segregation ATPase
VARIIAELQANPDAQTLLLRALLTNEFLGMPIRLERIEADLALLTSRMERVELDIAELKDNVKELTGNVKDLTGNVKELTGNVKELTGNVKELTGRMGRAEADIAVLKGDSLEVKLHRRIRPLLSQRLSLRRSRMMHSPIQDTSPELFEPVQSALDNGIITDAQETRINTTDIILRAQRKSDQAEVWVAVEVSNDISQNDIERAQQSAAALRAVFPEGAMAAVAGYRLHPRDQERADNANVHALLVEETG